MLAGRPVEHLRNEVATQRHRAGAAAVPIVGEDRQRQRARLGLVLFGHEALHLVEEHPGLLEVADEARVAGDVHQRQQQRGDTDLLQRGGDLGVRRCERLAGIGIVRHAGVLSPIGNYATRSSVIADLTILSAPVRIKSRPVRVDRGPDPRRGHTGVVADTDIHPELRSVARFLPRQPIRSWTLPASAPLDRLQRRHTTDDVEVLTLASGVDVRLHRPAGASQPTPALLWIHGGGYVMGTAAQDDMLCRRFVRTLGITVAVRRLPPGPGASLPGAAGGLLLALIVAGRLPAVDADRIAIGGASAGGGLAAALALLARDRAEVTTRASGAVYPMLDDRATSSRPGRSRSPIVECDQQSIRLAVLSRQRRSRGGGAGPTHRSRRSPAGLDWGRHRGSVSRRGPRLRRAAACCRCAV